MTTKVYASRDPAAFPSDQPVREHGGFYIATGQDEIQGTFEIIAEVDEQVFEIKHNSAAISYDDMSDLLSWATQ